MHGNPGNMTVFAMLCQKQFELSTRTLESLFRKKHPKYNHETGWLWITYKNLCDKDIDKTMTYLRDMYRESLQPMQPKD